VSVDGHAVEISVDGNAVETLRVHVHVHHNAVDIKIVDRVIVVALHMTHVCTWCLHYRSILWQRHGTRTRTRTRTEVMQ
jgi:hypothetical protein